MNVALFALAFTLGGGILFGLWKWTLPEIRGVLAYRRFVALSPAHEAGHAIVAWCSPDIRAIVQVDIKPHLDEQEQLYVGGTCVFNSAIDQPLPPWEDATILLGGLSGVVESERQLDPTGCAQDLARCLDAARAIETEAIPCPWRSTIETAPCELSPKIIAALPEPPSPQAATIIGMCFDEARLRVNRHSAAFHRLKNELRHRKRLEQAEIEVILGPRPIPAP